MDEPFEGLDVHVPQLVVGLLRVDARGAVDDGRDARRPQPFQIIVHSAASVDAQKTYDELRDVNVESLERIVNACASAPSVVLVSTLSVVPRDAHGWDGVGLVPPACAETLETGYARSKLVAEHRLSALRKEGRVGGGVAYYYGMRLA